MELHAGDEDQSEEESIHFSDSNSEEEEREDPGQDEPAMASPSRKRGKKSKVTGPPPMENFINKTAFDMYFAHASSRAKVSQNVLTSLVEPLTHQEVLELEKEVGRKAEASTEIQRLGRFHESYFPYYWMELHNGFNLLFYGYGSKRNILTAFGKQYCANRGHVVIINGYKKGVNLKSILSAIEGIPDLIHIETTTAGWEGQLRRIYEFFRRTESSPLYLIIHNVDSPPLRDPKVRTSLSTLALHPRIHLIASVDNINASVIWSSSELSARKHPPTSSNTSIPPDRGYAWLFHDLTTFRPYIDEMKSRDVSSLPSQGQIFSGTTGTGQALGEEAMSHVLASVTEKAKKLFRLLAKRQMAAIESSTGKQPTGITGLENYGTQYDLLFNEARKEFLATSDVALRALLGEFMDHEMIKSGGQPEVLWIPAGKEVIRRVLQKLPVD
ncbi:origin recognition complex subunit 2 [Serendipita vermifera]|nr:origin recognition complex subunit 2 [Serendipita vermifera]